jgi:hypothetical protein
VFKRSRFEEIQEDEMEVTVVGNVKISKEEASVLKLQPKFAVLRKLDNVEMETDLQLGFAKARYQLLAELAEK